ncbi:hypothetical protein JHL22_05135 [Advenella sp. WQ 585]|uniref:Uncharacterized protein n=2 Tax=Advenella mandrilli TaxID=2800330 RepID=A0ABS1EFI5_9BURK|nr:hypothetical protein [Advenella mandrilli]
MTQTAQTAQTTELVTLPAYENALQVFTTEDSLDQLYAEVENQVVGVVYDISTKKGRDQCASDAYKVARSKTAIEKLGAKLSAEYKEIPKKIDASRRRIKDRFDALQERIRKPLTEWEQAEEGRLAKHNAAVMRLNQAGANASTSLESNVLRQMIADVESTAVDESWEEFEAEAHRAKQKALDSLGFALADREKYEAEQAELTELRCKQAEQERKDREAEIARQAAEKAKADAETKARAEREEAAKREADIKAAAERAERERQEAIERQKQAEARAEAEKLASEQRAKEAAEAARQAEIARQEREKTKAEEEQRKREADREHRGNVNRIAMQALIDGGVPEECARQAIILIAKGEIPNVSINY